MFLFRLFLLLLFFKFRLFPFHIRFRLRFGIRSRNVHISSTRIHHTVNKCEFTYIVRLASVCVLVCRCVYASLNGFATITFLHALTLTVSIHLIRCDASSFHVTQTAVINVDVNNIIYSNSQRELVGRANGGKNNIVVRFTCLCGERVCVCIFKR